MILWPSTVILWQTTAILWHQTLIFRQCHPSYACMSYPKIAWQIYTLFALGSNVKWVFPWSKFNAQNFIIGGRNLRPPILNVWVFDIHLFTSLNKAWLCYPEFKQWKGYTNVYPDCKNLYQNARDPYSKQGCSPKAHGSVIAGPGSSQENQSDIQIPWTTQRIRSWNKKKLNVA